VCVITASVLDSRLDHVKYEETPLGAVEITGNA